MSRTAISRATPTLLSVATTRTLVAISTAAMTVTMIESDHLVRQVMVMLENRPESTMFIV